MIGIDSRHGMHHLDLRGLKLSMLGLDDRLHAGLPFFYTFQVADGNPQLAVCTHLPKGLVRRQGDRKLIAGAPACQGLLQAGQQGTVAMQVGQGLVPEGIEFLSGIVTDTETKTGNTSGGYLQGGFLSSSLARWQ